MTRDSTVTLCLFTLKERRKKSHHLHHFTLPSPSFLSLPVFGALLMAYPTWLAQKTIQVTKTPFFLREAVATWGLKRSHEMDHQL